MASPYARRSTASWRRANEPDPRPRRADLAPATPLGLSAALPDRARRRARDLRDAYRGPRAHPERRVHPRREPHELEGSAGARVHVPGRDPVHGADRAVRDVLLRRPHAPHLALPRPPRREPPPP